MVDVFYYDAFQKTISPEPEGGPLVRHSDYAALEAQLTEARRLILYAADSFAAHAKASDHPEEEDAYLSSEKMYRAAITAAQESGKP